MSIWDILTRYQEGLMRGLLGTLRLCAIIWSTGLIAGGLIGVGAAHWRRTLGYASRAVSFLLAGIPALVMLFWMHYPLQSMMGVVVDPFYTAAFSLALINTFTVSEIVKNVLVDFPSEYVLAARVCGVPPTTTLLRIKLPIVLRQMLPSLLMVQVTMLQMTLFASLISVNEIFRVAQQINAQIYRPIEVYSALALFFLAVCLPLNGLAVWLKWRFTRDISDR